VCLRRNRLLGLATVLAAVGLCGCAGPDLDSSQQLFPKRFNLFGPTNGYTFSDVQEARLDRPITANDLIAANGSCPPPVAPQPQGPPAGQAASAAEPPQPESLLGEGVALGMSECEVVYRAGQPSNVQLGNNPNGDRTAVLTFQSGPRPGIYRFERGRLMEMDEIAEPPPPVAAKKKPAKTKQTQKQNSQT
jgi:hypothetical protein